MIIRELIATFGSLKDRRLELKSGLNIVEGANESGKSTWCGFLRAMLYGIDTSARDKKGTISEKNRYRPWSGDLMSGVLTCEHDGGTVTVERHSTAQSPLRDINVRGINSTVDIGETLLGVSRTVFENSAFVSAPPISASTDELEKHISAAVVGGEAGSYTAASARLREMRNRLYSNKSNGLIPKLESEIERIQSELDLLLHLERETAEAEAGITPLDERLRTLRDELARHEAYKNVRAATELQTAEQQLEIAAAAVESARGELPDGFVSANELRELQAAVHAEAQRRDEATIQESQTTVKAKAAPARASLLILLCVLLFVAGAALYILLPSPYKLYSLFAPAVLVVLAPAIVLQRKHKTDALSEPQTAVIETHTYAAAARLEALLGTTDPEEAAEALSAALGAANVYEAALRERDAAERLYTSLLNAFDGVETSAAPDAPTTDRNTVEYEISEVEQELNALRSVVLRAEGAIGTRDSSALQGALETARLRLAALRRHLSAADAAKTLLDNADRRLSERFSPALTKETARILSQLTGGRYTRAAISRDFLPEAGSDSADGLRSILQLSDGTADQLWLAVRLAVVRLTLPPSVPLILDDALINFDDERVHAALRLLSEEARTRQVVLFTCHSREAAISQTANVVRL